MRPGQACCPTSTVTTQQGARCAGQHPKLFVTIRAGALASPVHRIVIVHGAEGAGDQLARHNLVQIRIGIRKFVTVFVLLDVDLAHNIRQVFYSSKASDNLDGRHVHLEDQVAAEQVRSIAQ